MPTKRYAGPCLDCGTMDPPDFYFKKKLCNNCYRKKNRRKRGLKKIGPQAYPGPCVNCGTMESSNGRFANKMCRTCYKRLSRGGNIVARTKFTGPCKECGKTGDIKYVKQLCDRCYKGKEYADKVKSKKKFCSDCGKQISRLSKTGRCAKCRYKFRYTNEETYRESFKKSRDKYTETEQGKQKRYHGWQKRYALLMGADPELTKDEWEEIKLFFLNRCAYCDKPLKNLTMDHVIPLSKGGKHNRSNIVPACRPCNASKGDRKPLRRVVTITGDVYDPESDFFKTFG